MTTPRPPFNHTRADGPYDPCPVCLPLMCPDDLAAFVADLRETIDDERELRKEAERATDEANDRAEKAERKHANLKEVWDEACGQVSEMCLYAGVPKEYVLDTWSLRDALVRLRGRAERLEVELKRAHECLDRFNYDPILSARDILKRAAL